MLNDRFVEAIKYFDLAILKDPKNLIFYHNKGKICLIFSIYLINALLDY